MKLYQKPKKKKKGLHPDPPKVDPEKKAYGQTVSSKNEGEGEL